LAEFHYEAVYGEVARSGTIEAKDSREAKQIILESASYVISLKQVGFLGVFTNDISIGKKKLKKRELAAFLQQLGMMLQTGISISEALISLARYGNGTSSELAARLHMDVTQGVNFSEAMYNQRELVGEDYSSIISVGISTGRLPDILKRVSQNLTKADSMSQKVSEALRTPLANIAMALGVGIYMFIAVVPQMISSMSEMLNGEVPLLTRIVMGISQALLSYGIFIAIPLIAGAAIGWILIRGKLKPQWEMLKATCPVFGKINTSKNMAMFFNSLSLAFLAGMDAGTAMKSATRAVNNDYIRKKLERAAYEVENSGVLLAAALEGLPMISGYDLQALYSGQKSGTMSEMSEYCSQRIDAENNELVQKLVDKLGPMATILSGAIIGVILFAMYSPMISMMTNMTV